MRSRYFLIGVIAALISCKESTSPPVPQSVTFSTDAIALVADDSVVAGVTITMSDGSPGSSAPISYSSSNSAVAFVDDQGFIHAFAAGTATIFAKVGTLHDEVTVTVRGHR